MPGILDNATQKGVRALSRAILLNLLQVVANKDVSSY
jgi:hypothetical protein